MIVTEEQCEQNLAVCLSKTPHQAPARVSGMTGGVAADSGHGGL